MIGIHAGAEREDDDLIAARTRLKPVLKEARARYAGGILVASPSPG